VIERPDVEVISFEVNMPLIFKATVPVRPEVEFKGDYTELEAQAPKIELDPAAVEDKLSKMREEKAAFVQVDRAIAEGDQAIIDFKGHLKGEEKPFEGGTAENFRAEIAPGRFIDGFMEALVGLKAGEEKEFDVDFPEQYHAPALAGKPATFAVKIHEVLERKVPELDDAFAASIGDYNTAEDLKAGVAKELTEEAEDNRELLLRQQILDQVLEKADVEVPESMINREIEFLMRQYLQVMQAQGMDVNQMMTRERLTEWRGNLREEAVKRIKTSLTLGTIAKAQGIVITSEEVDEEIVQYAAMYRVDPSSVREQLIQSGGWSTLADEVLSNKILDWLLEKAKVTEGEIPAKYAPLPEGVGAKEADDNAPEDEAEVEKEAATKEEKSDSATEGDAALESGEAAEDDAE
jgi:trigger factor